MYIQQSNRGTIFTRGVDIDQSTVSDMPRRNWKTNSFQNRTEFRAKTYFKKKERIDAKPPHKQSVEFYLLLSKRIAVTE
jgi:hypothetical protein